MVEQEVVFGHGLGLETNQCNLDVVGIILNTELRISLRVSITDYPNIEGRSNHRELFYLRLILIIKNYLI